MSERLIDKLANDISIEIEKTVFDGGFMAFAGQGNSKIKNLLIEFADEIKREAIGP